MASWKDPSRILRAARFSWLGLRWLALHEAAFRQELILFAVLLVLGAILGFTLSMQAVQVCLMVFVLVTEALNSAVEKVVDRVGREHHELSGLAKDMGSAAVLLSFVPLFIFWVHALFWH